jgi:YtkA-like
MTLNKVMPVLCAFSLAACGSSSPLTTTDSGTGDVIDCSTDPRVSQYAPNLTAKSQSGALTYILLSSDPAPPAAENNTWSMKITNDAGVAQPNVTATVVPFMPDMGHGTSIVPSMTSNGDGTYSVTPLYLFMAGIWSITFTTTPASGPTDSAAFFFCIEG